MWIAATPARAKDWTARTTLSSFPYPVSASAITGMPAAAVIRAAFSTISVIVSSP
jgi:hypothetical protein